MCPEPPHMGHVGGGQHLGQHLGHPLALFLMENISCIYRTHASRDGLRGVVGKIAANFFPHVWIMGTSIHGAQ